MAVGVPVQGDDAPRLIARALRHLDALPEVDVIVVARGGGSLEDLMAFNSEPVCRAVAASATPVVSAVGHERDVTLCDLVADVRVSTPTAAAAAVVPSREALETHLADSAQALRPRAAAGRGRAPRRRCGGRSGALARGARAGAGELAGAGSSGLAPRLARRRCGGPRPAAAGRAERAEAMLAPAVAAADRRARLRDRARRPTGGAVVADAAGVDAGPRAVDRSCATGA